MQKNAYLLAKIGADTPLKTSEILPKFCRNFANRSRRTRAPRPRPRRGRRAARRAPARRPAAGTHRPSSRNSTPMSPFRILLQKLKPCVTSFARLHRISITSSKKKKEETEALAFHREKARPRPRNIDSIRVCIIFWYCSVISFSNHAYRHHRQAGWQ